MNTLDNKALEQLFLNARTHNAWQDKPVSDEQLQELFDLCKMAPTSANCSPIRLLFVRSEAAKQKLKPALQEGNVEKTMAAPVTAIVAYDLDFYEHLPKLFPHTNAKSWFEGRETHIKNTAILNGSLQGGYLIMAARALGLDCGPMSGFSKKTVNEAFFANTNIKANFLMNIGYGDDEGLFPRSPRFDFDDVCEII
ncbi:MAG: malonic semialdehyde reductase [Gammaproteobacteria bacterium]|nr:malonic semialdehyde reductase [Gammaproteobacteria bacterium]NNC98319.1 malonic semialdehyde reductase [Gammaproteobacteria bacterium]NNM13375.1 malonic semialdehyde reductase [Gammaproteobacteria bacterium]